MKFAQKHQQFFPFGIPLPAEIWERLQLKETVLAQPISPAVPQIMMIRRLTDRLNRLPERSGSPASAGLLNLYGLLCKVYRYLVSKNEEGVPAYWENATAAAGYVFGTDARKIVQEFIGYFPPAEVATGRQNPSDFIADDDPAATRKKTLLCDMLLVRLAAENMALDPFRELVSDEKLIKRDHYRSFMSKTEMELERIPQVLPVDMSLPRLLRAPVKASPRSLAGQMEYIRTHWRHLLPAELLEEILVALDIVKEEARIWWGGPGKPQVLKFGPGAGMGYDYPEYERFSADTDWMSNVVMIAKMVYVWLDQLSRKYGRLISRLDQIPDEELDQLAGWGFTALWLIGLWERSPASQKIKQISGNPEAISSAYSLYDYTIADDLGGEEALNNLKWRAGQRGIRLASDMVPNHTGIFSRWTIEHPDWFIQLDYPPYPGYSFSGPDLSFDGRVSLFIEDGYWDKRDAAVVFKHVDNHSGRVRYIYHGNDGTSTPWNDTAQLNYLIAEVREAVIRTIIHVARQFPIIRFDAAMTLAKKHYQRLWFPQPGHGSGVPSRSEHGMSRETFDNVFPVEFWREVVDRVAAEAPDTLLLAEAFWLMEGYFVRTLGMHRVYNSAFMNMLKMEENAKYRQTVKNVLEFNPEILKRFVNFMNNPDERTAIEQFGKEKKYVGAAVLLVTMPGLPMFGHGQIEGFHEKYGMEYKRSYWDEPVDEHLVSVHEWNIFPLMRRRHLFSGSENFIFYDFFAGSHVDENVFAYSNRSGGDRGIVIYHNKYGSTAGWIRTSTVRAVKIDSGETVLRQTSLGEALGFNPDDRCYYGFRDYSGHLEYVRSGRELCEKGLYVELDAYDYHAFLDFREVWDDEYGTWGKMCHVLEGRPVPSLDEEVKKIRYGSAIAAFRETVEACAVFLLSSGGMQAQDSIRNRLNGLYELINESTMCSGNTDKVASEVILKMESCAGKGVVAAKPSAKPRGRKKTDVVPTADSLLLSAFLVMHYAGKLARGKDHAKTASCWFDELGLSSSFAGLYDSAIEGEEQILDGKGAALLVGSLIAQQEFFVGWKRSAAGKALAGIFEDKYSAQFILRHWSGGNEWFNKERFELLINRLAVAEEIVSLKVAPTAAKRQLTKISVKPEEVEYLCSLAAESGYQPGKLLELVKGPKVGQAGKTRAKPKVKPKE